MMMTVVIALAGCIYMAMYNTGYQAHLAISNGALPLDTWQTAAMEAMGFAFDPGNIWACIVHGALYYIPVLIVTFAVGGTWEVIFAIVRKHEVNEGFFVTGFLFPLILPATIPLCQVALGISFGVVGNYNPDDYNIWSSETNCAAPNVRSFPDWPDPAGDTTDNFSNQDRIDDLFHSAVNGRGDFLSAANPLFCLALTG